MLIAVATVLGVIALALVAFGIDSRANADTVARRVELAGQPIGGANRSQLERTTAQVAQLYRDALVRVRSPKGDLDATAASLGLTLDQPATVAAALAVDHEGSAVGRPISWARSLVADRSAPLRFTIDRKQLAVGLEPLDKANRLAPTEPNITANDTGLVAVAGANGEAVDIDDLAEQLRRAADTGVTPIVVDVTPKPVPPRFTEGNAKDFARRATELTQTPLALSVGGKSATIQSRTMRGWLKAVPGANGLELQIDQAKLEAQLPPLVNDLGTVPVPASFTVAADRPVIVDGQNGTICCAPDSAQRIAAAVTAGQNTLVLNLKPVPPAQDRAWAEKLKILEPIGSFTTPHACCEGRVVNIHRFADLIRGTVIEPGQTLSLNDRVGQRTEAKGFVNAPVIYNNTMDSDIGGGVSQFATTIFNAAFFGGLEFPEYQSHTVYISRYPYGREATISWTRPDLKIKNPTPYGVLVWPTYNDTSITVTLYSTRWATGDQTGQSEEPAGPCTRVKTQRTRTFASDGHAEADFVYAVYQPADGVRCP